MIKAKRFLAFMITIIMVLSLMPMNGVFAANEPNYGEYTDRFAGGTGAKDDPYLISKSEHMDQIQKLINQDRDLSDLYFRLENDIDLGRIRVGNPDAVGNIEEFNWTPIGWSESCKFNGKFDGNNCTITGYYVQYLARPNNHKNAGLFGCTGPNAEINNLTLKGTIQLYKKDEDVYYENIGGIVGLNYGTINNCTSKVDIFNVDIPTNDNKSITRNVGGIAGNNKGVIKNCCYTISYRSNGKIDTGSISLSQKGAYAGGIAGLHDGKIENCYTNVQTIKTAWPDAVEGCVGGIAGYVSKGATVKNVYSVPTKNDNIGSIQDVGSIVGKAADGHKIEKKSAFYPTTKESKSDKAYATPYDTSNFGFVAYHLQNNQPSSSGQVWGQGTDDTYALLTSDATKKVRKVDFVTSSSGTVDRYVNNNKSFGNKFLDPKTYGHDFWTTASDTSGQLFDKDTVVTKDMTVYGKNKSASTVTVSTDKDRYTYGDDVIITVTANNASSDADLVVTDENNASANIQFVENTSGGYQYKYTNPNAGDLNIKAKFGGSIYYSEAEGTKSVTVDKYTLSASDFKFNAPTGLTYDGNGKEATVSCKKSGIGKVTVKYFKVSSAEETTQAPKDAGEYLVKIDVAGNDNYNQASGLYDKTWKFTIAKATPQYEDIGVKYNGNSFAKDGSVPYTGNKVEFTISNDSIVENISYIKADGTTETPVEEIINPGKYKMVIVTNGEGNYKETTIYADFTVTKAVPTINITDIKPSYAYDDGITISGEVKGVANSANVDNVAKPKGKLEGAVITALGLPSETITYDEEGKFTFSVNQSKKNNDYYSSSIFAGNNYKVKFSLAGDEYYEKVDLLTDEFSITKSKVNFNVSNTQHMYTSGDKKEITVTTDVKHLPQDGIVVNYYEVDQNNDEFSTGAPVLKAVDPGKYMYVINLSDDTQKNYETAKPTYTVNTLISKKLPDNISAYGNVGFMEIKSGMEAAQEPISFKEGEVSLKIGDTTTNVLNNNNGSTVTYTSSNTDVATVDENGLVTAHKKGTATITAKSEKLNTTPVYASYTVKVGYATKILTAEDFVVTAQDKTYDGTKDVKLSAKLKDGVAYDGDNIRVEVSGSFENADAGSGKKVAYTITDISGTGVENYTLGTSGKVEVTAESSTVTADITKATVTVICSTTTTRTYDGNPQSIDVSAMANGSVFDSANYTVKYAKKNDDDTYGDATAMAPTDDGTYKISIEINDTHSGNYEIKNQPNATLVIKKATQDVFSIEGVPDVVYYGNTFEISTYGANGDVTYDCGTDGIISINKDQSGKMFATANKTGKVTITATSTKTGYADRKAVKTIDVKPRVLTPTVTVNDRIYNGTTTVDVKDISLSGVLEDETNHPDDVSANLAAVTAAMVNADAGTDKVVYVSGITLQGSKKDYYTLSTQSLQTTVDIDKREIKSFTFESADKTYDNSSVAAVNNIKLQAAADVTTNDQIGVISGDETQLTLNGAAFFESANQGLQTVKFTPTGLSGSKAANYILTAGETEATSQYTINPMEVFFTIGQTSFVYDGNDKAITSTAVDNNGRIFKEYDVKYYSGNNVSNNVNNDEVTPNAAGDYTAKVVLKSSNYTTKQDDIPVTITEATQNTLAIAGMKGTVRYGDTIELEAKGGNDGGNTQWKWEVVSESSGITVTPNENDKSKATVTIGDGAVGELAEIKVTKSVDNYNDISATTTFIPTAKPVTVSISNLEHTYGSVSDATVSVKYNNNEVDGATYKVTYNNEETVPVNAGTYTVKAEAYGNYSGEQTATFVINKATPQGQISGLDSTYTYGDQITVSTNNVTSGVDAEITYSGTGIYTKQTEVPKNVGNYAAVLTLSGANYETVSILETFKIEKADLHVWAESTSREYGAANPVFTIAYDNNDFKNGDTKDVIVSEPIATSEANALSDVGTYDIKVSGGIAENYKFVTDYDKNDKTKNVLTVTGAKGGSLTITGSPSLVNVGQIFTLSAFYGNTKVPVTWSLEPNDSDIVTIDQNGVVTAKKAGTVKIKATAGENFSNASTTFDLSVEKATVTLSARDNVKTYNGDVQHVTLVSSNANFVPVLTGDNKNVDIEYTLITDSNVKEAKNVGTYSVNYVINDESYTGGGNVMMYINKATVVTKVSDATKVYGDEFSDYNVEFTNNGGLVEAVRESVLAEIKAATTFASDGAAATAVVKEGGYEVIPTTTKTETDNVKFTVDKGILTVNPAPLTVAVKNVSREYGAPNPKLKEEYIGFKNNETKDVLTGELVLAYDESIKEDTAVGVYEDKTTASGLAGDNYTITFEPGDVEITKIKVTAVAGTSRSTYLTVKFNKEVKGLITDNFVVKNGEELVTLTEAKESSDGKTYMLMGTFKTGTTYTVEFNLTSETHEIISEPLSIRPTSPSSGGGGGGGGGGSISSTYTVTFDTNGGSEIANVKIAKNGKVTEPTAPEKEGYVFDGWYTDSKFTTEYDFDTKVTKNFTLYAKWTKDNKSDDKNDNKNDKPVSSEWKNPFVDVKENDWFFDSVRYANKNGLMNGSTTTEFAPNDSLTRAMLVTVLYRAAGEPAVNKSIPFGDIEAGAYYTNAVIWAKQNGIVNGVTENEFAPEENITREQIAAIMFRYAKYMKYDVSVGENTNILSYTDFADISEYAVEAFQYAVGSGLMKGKTNTTLNPKDNATRAEIAAILQRFIEGNK